MKHCSAVGADDRQRDARGDAMPGGAQAAALVEDPAVLRRDRVAQVEAAERGRRTAEELGGGRGGVDDPERVGLDEDDALAHRVLAAADRLDDLDARAQAGDREPEQRGEGDDDAGADREPRRPVDVELGDEEQHGARPEPGQHGGARAQRAVHAGAGLRAERGDERARGCAGSTRHVSLSIGARTASAHTPNRGSRPAWRVARHNPPPDLRHGGDEHGGSRRQGGDRHRLGARHRARDGGAALRARREGGDQRPRRRRRRPGGVGDRGRDRGLRRRPDEGGGARRARAGRRSTPGASSTSSSTTPATRSTRRCTSCPTTGGSGCSTSTSPCRSG